MSHSFILIPGRSARQGVTLNEGKYTDGYLDEISTLRMNPQDMQRLELSEGDQVRLRNDIGTIEVPVISGKDELPEGMLFICYGDLSSQLMGGETHGSGMPDSKGLDVELEVVATTSAADGRAAADTVTPAAEDSRPAVAPAGSHSAGIRSPAAGTRSVPDENRVHQPDHQTGRAPGTAILLLVGLFVLIALLLWMFSGS